MNSKSLHESPLADLYPDDPPLMEFGGWEMPRDFGGIVREHQAVRENCGIFDLSHMGRLVVRGDDVLEELDRLFTRSSRATEDGRALYGFFCNQQGGCLDDAIVYRKNETEAWLVVNAANRERIVDWIEDQSPVELEDRTFDTILLAVQGPNGPEILNDLPVPELPESMFRTRWDESTMIASTGYTGEPGGEIWMDVESGRELFQSMVDAERTFCGLGARDTLRLEKGFPLHGHELSNSIDPVTGGLDQFIDWNHEFIGRNALRSIHESGSTYTITGIMTEGRQSPREGYDLRTVDGDRGGFVTSGGYSPVLERGIGMAKIRSDIPEEEPLEMKLRSNWEDVEHVSPPFV
jgi:aminomethyltransferase